MNIIWIALLISVVSMYFDMKTQYKNPLLFTVSIAAMFIFCVSVLIM